MRRILIWGYATALLVLMTAVIVWWGFDIWAKEGPLFVVFFAVLASLTLGAAIVFLYSCAQNWINASENRCDMNRG